MLSPHQIAQAADLQGSLVVSQVTVSGMVVLAIEIVKKLTGKALSPDAVDMLQKTLAVIGALGTAMGLHMTYASSAGDLTIHGLTAANLMWGMAHAVRSFIFQEAEYRGYKLSKVTQYIPKLVQLMEQSQPPSEAAK